MSIHEQTEHRALHENTVLRSLTPREDASLVLVSLRTALAMNRKIVEALITQRTFDRKEDQSPATETDRLCEDLAREMFHDAFGTAVTFMGEESGGTFNENGYCLAVDPIDGTWGFIGDTGMFSAVINIYKDGKPHLGLVSQPTGSEMMYAVGDEPTRLLRAERWGIGNNWQTMPQIQDQKSALVNMQWQKNDDDLMTALAKAWKQNTIQQVRSTGGSPALSMAEVAKGSTMYASNWKKASSPHDLGAGIKIIENAGGSTVDLDGAPIQPIGHAGIFVAGLHKEHQDIVRGIIRNAMPA